MSNTELEAPKPPERMRYLDVAAVARIAHDTTHAASQPLGGGMAAFGHLTAAEREEAQHCVGAIVRGQVTLGPASFVDMFLRGGSSYAANTPLTVPDAYRELWMSTVLALLKLAVPFPAFVDQTVTPATWTPCEQHASADDMPARR